MLTSSIVLPRGSIKAVNLGNFYVFALIFSDLMSDELPTLTITELKTEKVEEESSSNKRSATETQPGPRTKRLKVSIYYHQFVIIT